RDVAGFPISEARIELCLAVVGLSLLEHREILDCFFPLRLVEVKAPQFKSSLRVNRAAVYVGVKLKCVLEIDRARRIAIFRERAFQISFESLRRYLGRFLYQLIS